MAGLYPEEQTLHIFGTEVSWPGMDPDTGKFANGDFNDPLKKPSFIPADTILFWTIYKISLPDLA
jgi:hypothetical protein